MPFHQEAYASSGTFTAFQNVNSGLVPARSNVVLQDQLTVVVIRLDASYSNLNCSVVPLICAQAERLANTQTPSLPPLVIVTLSDIVAEEPAVLDATVPNVNPPAPSKSLRIVPKPATVRTYAEPS